jgi:hypothetical protein
VTTDAHQVTGDQTGPHKCDGTNGGANATPGPTATGALDDASDSFNFSWSGTWTESFEDFQINQIGSDAATDSQFWGYAINGKQAQVGGCQFLVEVGDEVLFAYDLFSKKHVLLLSGPRRVRAGKRFSVRVIDGGTGKGVEDVRIGGEETNAKGVARLRYRSTGVKRLKARRADSVRSNLLRVKVLRRR